MSTIKEYKIDAPDLIMLYDFLFKAATTEDEDRLVRCGRFSDKAKKRSRDKSHRDDIYVWMITTNGKMAEEFKVFMEDRFFEKIPVLDSEKKVVTIKDFLSERRVKLIQEVLKYGFVDLTPLDFFGFDPSIASAYIHNKEALEDFVKMLVLEAIEKHAGSALVFQSISKTEQLRATTDLIYEDVFLALMEDI